MNPVVSGCTYRPKLALIAVFAVPNGSYVMPSLGDKDDQQVMPGSVSHVMAS